MTDNKPNVLGDALASNYMLASLNVRNWQATKTDRNAARELTESKGADADAAKVVKKLLVGAEKELKEVQAAYTSIRTFFYQNSLPWTVTTTGALKGDRLVAVMDSMNFLSKFASLKNQADQLLKDFVANHYEPAKQLAQAHAGGLWNEDEYPTGSQVQELFGAHLSLRPMPAVNDFDRLAIPGKLADGLKDLYQRHTEVQIENAMADLQQRVVSELNRFIVQMNKVANEEGTRLYESLHSNLLHLSRMCKNLNLRGEQALHTLSLDINSLVSGEVSAYKGNVSLARAARNEAQRLLDLAKHPETFGLTGDEVEPELEDEDVPNDEPPSEPPADTEDEDALDKEVEDMLRGVDAELEDKRDASDFDMNEVYY